MKISIKKVLIVTGLLQACSSTGPVTIRESAPTQASSPPVEVPQNNQTPPAPVAMVQPVMPKQSQHHVPLLQSLTTQTDQALKQASYTQAINLAERALRIDRRDAYFYYALATAYKALGNSNQSVYFANQGLRYVKKDTPLLSDLNALAHP